MFCCTLLCVHSGAAVVLVGRRELVALLDLSSWCLVVAERLFLAVPWGCPRFVIVVFPDHSHLLFFIGGSGNSVAPESASGSASGLYLVVVDARLSGNKRGKSVVTVPFLTASLLG